MANIEDKAKLLMAFIVWLEENNMQIAGPTFNKLSGMHSLQPLLPADRIAVIADFLTGQETTDKDNKYDGI